MIKSKLKKGKFDAGARLFTQAVAYDGSGFKYHLRIELNKNIKFLVKNKM